MARALTPGPLGTETRQSTFATESLTPGTLQTSWVDEHDQPAHLHLRVEPMDLSLLPSALVPPPPQSGTPVDAKRRLTSGEIALCEKLFKGSINYTQVWIHRNEFLPFGLQPDDTAMTPNGEIYFNYAKFEEDFSLKDAATQWWFMHEMVHVWQHQLGYWVMLRGAIRIGLGYEYKLAPGRSLGDYNMEAQGNLLADYFVLKHLQDASVMAQPKYSKDLPLFEVVLSGFLQNPSDHAHLP
ncbi:hypothetical protein [Roseateles amylovorans]|uniref:Type IV secretion protein Rhs n=1 Tax=Roseateles amylovorans TaxID=2978473 RepID=A0ABY6AZJ7_9BURK|nr:hypothetical protein [Roseateles amylovorans]UXH77164.1 hypothetical protein N4261_19410 [Roseateles amylovorans]